MTTYRDKDSVSGLARTDFGLAMGECTILPFTVEGLASIEARQLVPANTFEALLESIKYIQSFLLFN